VIRLLTSPMLPSARTGLTLETSVTPAQYRPFVFDLKVKTEPAPLGDRSHERVILVLGMGAAYFTPIDLLVFSSFFGER